MATSPARKLRLVDPDTGEITACPGCHSWEKTYAELERKYRGALSQIGQLRADKEAEARQHELWPQAVELFDLWKLWTGHKRARWTPDRFWLIEKYLRNEGYADCKLALVGLMQSKWHMKRGQYKNREGSKFDEFERPFASQKDFERFRDSIPSPSPQTVKFFEWYEALPA